MADPRFKMKPLTDAIDDWLDDLTDAGLSRQSITTYRYQVNALAALTCGQWPGVDDLRRWRHSLREQSQTTRHHKVTTIRQFLRWAVEEGHIAPGAARGLKPPPRPKSLPPTLTRAERERLLDKRLRLPYRHGERHLIIRDLAICRLILLAGLRRAEVCALNVGDVTDEAVRVIAGKGQRGRVVPFGERLQRELAPFVRGREPGEPLFTQRSSSERLSPAALDIIFQRKISPAIGRRVHAHMLRHAYATELYRRGTGLMEIKELLGHSSVQTTQVYVNITAADLRAAVRVLDD